MKNKKIKLLDGMKYFIKLSLSFLICLILLAIIGGFNNSIILIVSFVLLVAYWIYSFKSSQKYVSKEEFLELTKDYATQYVVNILKKQNFSDKEINDMMIKRGRIISIKSNNDVVTPAVKKVLEEFNKLDGIERVKFRLSFRVYYSDMIAPDDWIQEYSDFCKKYDIQDYSEYEYIQNVIMSDMRENISKYYDEVYNKLVNFNKNNKYEDFINVDILSISDKKIKDKLGLGYEKLCFYNNELYILSNDFCIFFSDTYYKNYEDQMQTIINYIDGNYDVEKNTIVKIKYDDIIFYIPEGNIDVNTIVSGGGMSGNNISGLGAEVYQNNKMPFAPTGDAGAVYSMLKNIKIDPIKTDIVTSDNRVVVIKTNKMDLVLSREKDREDLYSWLVDKMPEKDYERIILKNNEIGVKSSNSSNLDEIKKLKELLDMGAITQEEFNDKKKELLNSKTTD